MGRSQAWRMGWSRPVHRKSPDARGVRALPVGRKLLRSKLRNVGLGIRGILRGFGLNVGEVSRAGSARISGLRRRNTSPAWCAPHSMRRPTPC